MQVLVQQITGDRRPGQVLHRDWLRCQLPQACQEHQAVIVGSTLRRDLAAVGQLPRCDVEEGDVRHRGEVECMAEDRRFDEEEEEHPLLFLFLFLFEETSAFAPLSDMRVRRQLESMS